MGGYLKGQLGMSLRLRRSMMRITNNEIPISMDIADAG
jgi:hypothetical protein